MSDSGYWVTVSAIVAVAVFLLVGECAYREGLRRGRCEMAQGEWRDLESGTGHVCVSPAGFVINVERSR
jgi:hypothetical protein